MELRKVYKNSLISNRTQNSKRTVSAQNNLSKYQLNRKQAEKCREKSWRINSFSCNTALTVVEVNASNYPSKIDHVILVGDKSYHQLW